MPPARRIAVLKYASLLYLLSLVSSWWRNRDRCEAAIAVLSEKESYELSPAGRRIWREERRNRRMPQAGAPRLTQNRKLHSNKPWGIAISPRGDMPKHRVPHNTGRLSCQPSTKSPARNSRA